MVTGPSQLATSLVAIALLLLGAPLIPGVIARTKAILSGRRGPPVWQLYADLRKLVRRGTVYSTTTTWVFRLAPVVLLATTLAAAVLLPLDGARATISFAGDAIAFVYLLALGRFAIVLAALDTGSSFEGMGASRDVAFASLAEVGFFIALIALGVMAHAFSLSQMLGETPARSLAAGGTTAAASVLLALGVFAMALVECARVPVDDPATHLELTMIHEVMVLDNSGPDLAMILYAGALKLAIFGAILLGVVMPGPRGGWSGLITLVASFFVIGIAVGIVESVVARLRIPKVPLYIAAGGSLALFGLILHLR